MSERKSVYPKDEGGCCKFLYNKETGEVLGRTGCSWFKIFVFYCFFYLALAAFFALMLYIFYLTVDTSKPKYTGNSSLIGSQPGVAFRPRPDQDINVDSTLVWVQQSKDAEDKEKSAAFWAGQMRGILNLYEKVQVKAKDCGHETDGNNGAFGFTDKAKPDAACKVNTKNLGRCTSENDFGYLSGAPCVMIKLNRIFDWKPVGYLTNGKNFNKDKYLKDVEKDTAIPNALKDYIKKTVGEEADEKKAKQIADTVWITCEGENPADRANMGEIIYNPLPGIPASYFPFHKQKDFLSPFIMVQFARPTPGVLINIECKAWAANIEPDRIIRSGLIHFEILMD